MDEKALDRISPEEIREWWESVQVGRRYRIRYRPDYWSSGGGSMNLTANLIGRLVQSGRGLATGHTELATGVLESKNLNFMVIREEVGIFRVKAKTPTSIPGDAICSITEC